MARGNFRTDETICVFCGHSEMLDDKRVKMPFKIGKGANKTYLCERCFNNSRYSKETEIEKYKNI